MILLYVEETNISLDNLNEILNNAIESENWIIAQGFRWALSKESLNIFDWTDTVWENLEDFWYDNFEVIKK